MVSMTDEPTDTSAARDPRRDGERDRDDGASDASPPPPVGEQPLGASGTAGAPGPSGRSGRSGSTRASATDTPGTRTGPGPGTRGTSTDGTTFGEPAGDGEPDAQKPRMRRGTERDRVLAGVCHGAGRYFGVDPVIFRIVLAVLALTGGIGLIVYGMGWLTVPQEGEDESEAHRLLSGRIEGAPLTAVLMALVGCGLYASMIGNAANQSFSLILLSATIGAVYWSQQRGRMQAAGEAPFPAASAVADAPPAAQAPPEPGSTPSWWRDPLTKEPAYLWGPDDGPYGEEDRRAWRERKSKQRKERLWPFGLAVFLLAVTAAGVGTAASWRYRPMGTSAETGLASALGVFGLAYVVASFAGRPRGGTLFWTLLTLAGLIGAASLPKDQAGWSTQWRPATAAAVQQTYSRGAGNGTLDLRRIALGGRTVSTRLTVGAGEALVELPPDATVVLDYHIGVGDVLLPERSHSGVNIRGGVKERTVYRPARGTASTGTVDLTVHVGVGDMRVVR